MIQGRGGRAFGPSRRAVLLLLATTGLALLGLGWSPLWAVALGADLLWLLAFLADGLRVRSSRLLAERRLPEVLVAFAPNRVEVALHNPSERLVHGVWLDTPPPGVDAPARRQPFALGGGERLLASYVLPSPPRGRLAFGDLHAEVEGPWRLAVRMMRFPATTEARSLPGLSDLMEGELKVKQHRESGRVRLRRLIEGREFDSLRELRPGDDVRMIDWKASARRGEPVVREYAPERNQLVMLMVDCGRHMVAHQSGRSKLDHALQAALRLARTCLDRGDAVGLLTFGSTVRAFVAPAKGPGQLRALIDSSFEAQPELEESDYRAAFDLVQQRVQRRALICVFTELGDEDSSRVLFGRALALRPKHLPVLVTLADAELAQLIRQPPPDVETAYARSAAVRLERERDRACIRLRGGGVALVRAPAEKLSLTTIDAYLGIKSRGLL